MNIRVVDRRWVIISLGAFMLLATGCIHEEEVTLDEPSARASLITFLDAWQAGSTAESLQQASPPIQVSDADWEAGATLVSYQLAGDLINDGSNLETLVDLTVRRSGRAEVVRARYSISTQPAITITRTDLPPDSAD